jgi:hypothetical protein
MPGARNLKMLHKGVFEMPLPLLALLTGAAVGKAASKKEKRVAVNGRMKKDGTRGKAYTRRKTR